MPYLRRQFLKQSLAAAALPLVPNSLWSMSTPPATIALQLWTVRNQIAKDLDHTLLRIKQMGYNYLETAFWPEHISLVQGAASIKKAGLKVCSIHCELDNQQQWLELRDAYECDTMIWHGWPEDDRYKTESGIQELAERYNKAFEFADKHRLRFGLHNHWWEFQQNEHGEYPWEKLKPLLHPEIFFEIDTYWVKVAGQDPAAVVASMGARAPFLHIKDGPARYTESLGKDEPEPMVAVGQGTQDFPTIVKAAAGNTQWMVVEMDVIEGDVFKAVSESFDFLIENQLGRPHLH